MHTHTQHCIGFFSLVYVWLSVRVKSGLLEAGNQAGIRWLVAQPPRFMLIMLISVRKEAEKT